MKKVRFLKAYEKKQRGCAYCLDMSVLHDESDKPHFTCKHDKCPYTVLDKYETYDEFLASEDSKILVPQFFEAAQELFRLTKISNKPQRMFSDGSGTAYL